MGVIKSLSTATACKAKKGEDRQAYLTRLVTAVSGMTEDDWAKLPDDAQDWTNIAITAIKDKNEIPEPEPETPVAEEAPAPKAKKPTKPAAEEVEEEEEEEADDEEEEAEEDEKPAKKPTAKPKGTAFQAKPGGPADKFRLTFVKELCAGKEPKPGELVKRLGIELSDNYSSGLAYDIKKTVTALVQAGLLSVTASQPKPKPSPKPAKPAAEDVEEEAEEEEVEEAPAPKKPSKKPAKV